MLELKDIKKDYPAGDGIVHALKGINLQFRKNEFVAILGPSGCGKTTMLNIIGGLDQYTSGDLVINGVSKAERRERAKKALEQVGLGNQLKKKPSQMSGGQMQRVAIARALVNNPDIILADDSPDLFHPEVRQRRTR